MNNTKKKILENSLTLFMQKSYKEVTMSDIINSVELTKGAFYHYFKSKEDVYEQCVKHFYEQILMSDFESFPHDSLKEFYNHYLEKLVENERVETTASTPSRFIFILESSLKIPSFMDMHESQRKKELNEWTLIVEKAKKSDEILSDLPSINIAQMFLNLSDGIVLNNMFNNIQNATIANEIKICWDNLYNLLTK